MRLNQSYKIRLYIMSIALLGSFFFMVYLGVNLWQAKSSEHKISELESIHYPIIENLVLLKDDLDEIREGLTSAIILENEFLIDEALELGPNFQLRLDTVRSLIAASDDQASLKALEVINDGFQEYLKSAGRLASRLVNSDDGLELYEEIANRTHQLYAQLNTAISQLLNDKQEDYGVHLHQIHNTLETTNNVAAIVGFIFVLGLIGLTWTITRLVVKAVNRADH